MSSGYGRASSPAKPFEFIEAFPAGSVSATARDMCNFMIAHLQNGQFGSVQILRPETATLMHSRLFGTDDRMNGMAHGFYEESANGHRIIGHGGDLELFHSDLHLILDSNVGFFVSYNSAGKGEIDPRGVLFKKFLDRYFPYTEPPAGKIENAQADAASVVGLYQSSRRFENSFLKLTTLLSELKVSVNPDGTISISPFKGPNGQLLKFEEIGPLLYREVNGRAHVGFKRDGNGQMQLRLDWPFFIFQKVGFLENKYFNYTLAIFGLVVVVLTLLLWPVSALVRKHYGRPLDLTPLQRKLRLGVRLVCILFILFFGGWLAVLATASGSVGAINAVAPWIVCLGILGVLCVFGVVFALRERTSKLEHAQPLDLDPIARYGTGARLPRPGLVRGHLESHELQPPLLSRIGSRCLLCHPASFKAFHQVSDRLFLYQEWVPQVSILRSGRLRPFKCKFTRSETQLHFPGVKANLSDGQTSFIELPLVETF